MTGGRGAPYPGPDRDGCVPSTPGPNFIETTFPEREADMPDPGYRFLEWKTGWARSEDADMKIASPSGGTKAPGCSRGVWLGLLVVLACGGAAALMLFFIAGDWPDARGPIVAGAQSIKQDRVVPPVEGDAGLQDAGLEEAPAVPASNSVARQADAWDMRACMPQIARISDFLTQGQSYTALSQRVRPQAQEGSFSATIAARDRTGLDTISTLVSVPVGDRACRSAYQTVAAFGERCGAVQATYFATFAENVAFGDRVQAWHNGQGSYVYFLPFSGDGCVVVKTQMFD